MARTRLSTDMAFVKSVYTPGINRVQMERYNRVKYANMPPPSVELIVDVLKKTGLSQYDFEMRFGMYENTIALVKMGNRNMPKAYWHVFYDYDNLDKIYKEVTKCIKSALSGVKNKKQPNKKSKVIIPEANKNILDEFRARISG
jgi:hypothetical protein